jgi:16S rRNA (adenine1518-N6/adenine1519-N6)-dimethyltransferase
MEHVQTKREIEQTLAAAGLHPRKRFGQHFLIDGNLMRRLVDSAELTPDDLVLEVGPGTGGLTDLLARRAGRVVCVEIDRNLVAILNERFQNAANVTLVEGDVLVSKHTIDPRIAEWIRDYPGLHGGRVPHRLRWGTEKSEGPSPAPRGGAPTTSAIKLVSNLPYQVATPLVMDLLIDHPQVRRMCFTVQAEVAERITAEPGGKDYGPLSILCQCLCNVATIARIGPHCFWPAPAVDSVMLRLDVRDHALVERDELPAFAAFVRSAFDHRRKQLRTALKHVLGDKNRARLPVRFDATRRPEELSIHDWLGLYRAIREGSEPGAQATGRS